MKARVPHWPLERVERRCRDCGIGTIRPTARKGRRARYKTMELELPSSFLLPTCDNCGSEWIDQATAKAVDNVLELSYRKALRRTFDGLISKITSFAPMRQIESHI